MLGLLLPVALGNFTADDDLKSRLLAGYRLPTTHPVAAAAQLGLDSSNTCASSFTPVSLQIYVECAPPAPPLLAAAMPAA